MKEVDPIKGLTDLANQESAVEAVENTDPFSLQYAPGLSLIILMRIYDVVMAQYREVDPEKAKLLLKYHAEGKIVGPMPYLDMEPDE